MSEKYPVGAKVLCDDIEGEIITNFKCPNDVCVEWENGLVASYDEDWLDEYAMVIS